MLVRPGFALVCHKMRHFNQPYMNQSLTAQFVHKSRRSPTAPPRCAHSTKNGDKRHNHPQQQGLSLVAWCLTGTVMGREFDHVQTTLGQRLGQNTPAWPQPWISALEHFLQCVALAVPAKCLIYLSRHGLTNLWITLWANPRYGPKRQGTIRVFTHTAKRQHQQIYPF